MFLEMGRSLMALCDSAYRWHFMYDYIVGEHVRRRRDMWSWERIRSHRHFFHEYKRLWVHKLTSYMLSAQDKLDIEVVFTVFISMCLSVL